MNKVLVMVLDLVLARVVLPLVMFVLARVLPKALLPVAGPVVVFALPVVARYGWRFVKQAKAKVA